MNKVTRFTLLGLGLAALLYYAGCKQGPGDRCQVLDDCQDGLVCNTATHVCQGGGGMGIDATVPDAPIDALHDAPHDTSTPGDI